MIVAIITICECPHCGGKFGEVDTSMVPKSGSEDTK